MLSCFFVIIFCDSTNMPRTYVKDKKPFKKTVVRRKAPSEYRPRIFHPAKGLPVGFPATNKVRLRYCVGKTLVPGVTSANLFFRANSVFDPEEAAGGHQAQAFDTWSTFYNHYLVESSTIKVTYAPNDATAYAGFMVYGITVNDDTTTTTNVVTAMEQSQTVAKYGSPSVNAHAPVTVYHKWSAKDNMNITNIRDNWARLGALVTTNPNEQAYFKVWTQNANESASSPNIRIFVTLEYIVNFSEPKELPIA
jgi:hypothetical protein